VRWCAALIKILLAGVPLLLLFFFSLGQASELSVPVRLLCSGWSNNACVSSLDRALGYR
jgi:hypothetical protein